MFGIRHGAFWSYVHEIHSVCRMCVVGSLCILMLGISQTLCMTSATALLFTESN